MSVKTQWKEASTLIIVARSFLNNSRLSKENFKICHANVNEYGNFKVLALMRSNRTSFMPGGYVFPGGSVDKADSSIDWLHLFDHFGFKEKDLPSNNSLNSILQREPNDGISKSLSLRITAIRETFEECGILLCKKMVVGLPVYSKVSSNWSSFLSGSEILEWQKRVQSKPSEFVKLCKYLNCYPDVWSLQLWSNWLTPIQHRARFDTTFFIATADQLPPVFIDNAEIIGFKWSTPTHLLDMCIKRDIWLPPPQYYEVARLKNFDSIEKLSKVAEHRNTLQCERWMPVQIKTPKGQISLLPGDSMYPSKPIYESGKQLELEDDMEEPINENVPLNRMILKGQDHTRIVLRNISPNSNNVLPWIAPGDESP